MIFRPHSYQTRAIDFIIQHPYSGLFVDMGLGKTVSALTAVSRLMNDYVEVSKALVIAPKSVALNTWSAEINKWEHLSGLTFSIVMGTPPQRREALDREADIYVTNRDNTEWMVSECLDIRKQWPFEMVIIDESSSFKNYKSKRWKALWRARPLINRLLLLTGTPSPNGLTDLWAQIKLIDCGERLGKYITTYRGRYFHPGSRNGAVVYEWLPDKGAAEAIASKISDVCLSMKAEDYLSLPSIIQAGMALSLPEIQAYKNFEKDCILKLKDTKIEAVTAVSLSNKLLQFASGAVYDDDHEWHTVSNAKCEALSDILDSTSEPVLVYYNFQHEKERILADHPEAVVFKGETDILKEWNAGSIRVLLCHPASVGYGLNMQEGGHVIVWYSPTWNLELYLQANARLHRQGQKKPVIMYHLICSGTIDEVVMAALREKGDMQAYLMEHLKHLKQCVID